MKITVIGSGYVGLVTGVCFAEFGIHVTCVDKNKDKINSLNQGKVPIYEPGLDALIASNRAKGRLSFTTDLAKATEGAQVIFLAVGTPPCPQTSQADLSYIFQAAKEIAPHIKDYTVVATKSTVPVGTGRKIREVIHAENPQADFDVVSNPEFLREGSAIEDFMKPDRVVIGASSGRAKTVMKRLYQPLDAIETPIVFTSLETSELIKYATNAFLATKITFINELADFCEEANTDIQLVSQCMGLDGRISSRFLQAGPGYGGSCFPKDTKALAHSAKETETPLKVVEAVISSNENRKLRMAKKIVKACEGSVEGKKIAVLGVTFKPNTDDMRESPSLVIIPELQKAGATIFAYDPEGMKEAQKYLSGVTWVKNSYETLNQADALVILTEWNEFRALDLSIIKQLMKKPLLIDLRNIYDACELEENGFDYHCVGRPASYGYSTVQMTKQFGT